MMPYDWDRTVRARYQNDAHFKHLVDCLEHAIHQAKYTPSELREAAILAAIHYEHHTLRQSFVRDDERDEMWRALDSIHERLQQEGKKR
jgi:heterodisulfide reductase subunit B